MKSMSDTDFGSLCNIHSRHVSYLNILHVFVIVMDNLSDFVVFVLSKIVLHLGVPVSYTHLTLPTNREV